MAGQRAPRAPDAKSTGARSTPPRRLSCRFGFTRRDLWRTSPAAARRAGRHVSFQGEHKDERMGSVIKKRRKRMAKKKHRKLLRKTRHQRRNKK
jgi:hypothetical protein